MIHGPSRRNVARDIAVVCVTFAILIVMTFPFLWVVLTSIRPDSELLSTRFRLLSDTLTLRNYRTLLGGGAPFPTYIRNSFFICTVATACSIAVSLLAAYAFSRRRFRGRSALLLLVVATQLFPFVVLITPVYAIFYRLRLVNSYPGLIIAYIAITIPFSVYLLLGYLDTIPRELDEAGIMDGCSTLRVITKVVLPIAWPGVIVVATYAFISAWDEFLLALTLMTKSELKTVPVGLAGFFGEFTTQWNLVMAASTIATLPTLLLFLVLQRRLVSELAAGAVKG